MEILGLIGVLIVGIFLIFDRIQRIIRNFRAIKKGVETLERYAEEDAAQKVAQAQRDQEERLYRESLEEACRERGTPEARSDAFQEAQIRAQLSAGEVYGSGDRSDWPRETTEIILYGTGLLRNLGENPRTPDPADLRRPNPGVSRYQWTQGPQL